MATNFIISSLSIFTMKIYFLLSMLSSLSFILVSIMATPTNAFTNLPESSKNSLQLSPSNAIFQKYIKAAQIIPAAYSHCLTHHHLATECVTAGCMAGIGDWLAQRKSSDGSKPWNVKRSFHFFLKGLGEGVMWSFWYHKADLWVTLLTQSAMASGFVAPSMEAVYRTAVALILDLFIACPLIYGLWDIPFPALLSGVPLRKIPNRVKSKLGEMMFASFKLWTPVNILIYNSPLQYRVLLMSTADVFWQSIVSAIASREVGNDEETPAPEQQQQEKPGIFPIPQPPTGPVPTASCNMADEIKMGESRVYQE
jgi:hypothetical protein